MGEALQVSRGEENRLTEESAKVAKQIRTRFEFLSNKYGDEVARVDTMSLLFCSTEGRWKCSYCEREFNGLPDIWFDCGGSGDKDCDKLFSKFDYSKHYRAYLNTPRWKRKRMDVLEKSGFRCRLCGSGINLNVHHITYENIPAEHDDDLIAVCKRCHDKIHEADIKSKGEC